MTPADKRAYNRRYYLEHRQLKGGHKPPPPAPCHADRVHYGNGLCKQCWFAEYRRQRPAYFKEKRRASYHKTKVRTLGRLREKLYGMTPDEYRDHVVGQAGRCLICLRVSEGSLAVDHDHRTGKVRGLLCGACNGGLGMFKDDPRRLRAAIDYLARAA